MNTPGYCSFFLYPLSSLGIVCPFIITNTYSIHFLWVPFICTVTHVHYISVRLAYPYAAPPLVCWIVPCTVGFVLYLPVVCRRALGTVSFTGTVRCIMCLFIRMNHVRPKFLVRISAPGTGSFIHILYLSFAGLPSVQVAVHIFCTCCL